MTRKMMVTVLGSTGSIGKSTLDVMARHPDRFALHALTANTQVDLMFEQCMRWRPRHAVMAHEPAGRLLRDRLRAQGVEIKVSWGAKALDEVASDPAVDAVQLSRSRCTARLGSRAWITRG